jgi:hypothetical protein
LIPRSNAHPITTGFENWTTIREELYNNSAGVNDAGWVVFRNAVTGRA